MPDPMTAYAFWSIQAAAVAAVLIVCGLYLILTQTVGTREQRRELRWAIYAFAPAATLALIGLFQWMFEL